MSSVDRKALTLIWLKQLGRWLARLRMAVLAILPIVSVIAWLWLVGCTEPHFRWSGLFLQTLGVFNVAIGVASTRRQFGRPSLADRVEAFIRERPRFPKSAIVAVGASLGGISTSAAVGTVGVTASTAQPIDARVLVLEKQMQEIMINATRDKTELLQKLAEHQNLIEAESTSRSTADVEIHQKLEMTATGGLDLTLCGAAWLLFGSTLGSLSVELARVL
ncbi:hypothetical protein [Paraburkholderia acidisoli]|uniref:Uncharacterized protein n=1 Tax=Paraburkholderia acidisoli TaxID=2571748 RepID=A0A7Z2GIK9_9BURK|nr:hypothetical protein [Paraburkholderia acidisoli]QGZ62104.1 hypothetical protein FAZ98_10395 [Paraburkholderia acidisoli]